MEFEFIIVGYGKNEENAVETFTMYLLIVYSKLLLEATFQFS
jgi:hypothetical protein